MLTIASKPFCAKGLGPGTVLARASVAWAVAPGIHAMIRPQMGPEFPFLPPYRLKRGS